MGKLKKITKYLAFAGGFILLLATSGQAASVIDVPHNETNDIVCGRCHSYSLWWNFSPASPSDFTAYAGVANAVCNTCHDSVNGPYFMKAGHNSLSMGRQYPYPTPANWERACVDCHDPHWQAQLEHLPVNPVFNDGSLAGGVYLAEGTMSNIPALPTGGLMTFDFSSALAKSGWDDVVDWNMKSGNADRGLILVLGYGTSEKTYEITSASAPGLLPTALPASGTGTITVQVGSDPIPASYEGTNFGIAYGQLIKTSIDTRDELDTATIIPKTVIFFDSKNSGFVDTNLTDNSGVATGICQVCHYNTIHYNQNGTENQASDPITHWVGDQCTTCHPIAKGFKPEFTPHEQFISRTTCGGCHDDVTFPNIVSDIHNSNCTFCHLDGLIPQLKLTTFRSYPPGPTSWPTGSTPPNSGDCAQCHGADYFIATVANGGHPGRDNHALNSRTGLPQVTGNENCTTACHFHKNKDAVTEIHDRAGAGGTAPCDKCHDVAAGGVLRIPGATSLAQVVTPGDCTACHTTIAQKYQDHPSPNNVDHTGQVEFNTVPGSTCWDPDPQDGQGCHDAYDAAAQVHSAQCATCHAVNGALIGSAADYYAGGTATCSTCHLVQTPIDNHWLMSPVLTMDSEQIAYLTHDPVISLEPLAQTTTVTDPNNDWQNGSLTVQITGGSDLADQLSIIVDDPVLTIDGFGQIFSNSILIGYTLSPSAPGSIPLIISDFSPLATEADVLEIIRHIGFSSSGDAAGSRTVTFTVADGAGNVGAGNRTVIVSDVNDAPVATSDGALAAANEDDVNPAGEAVSALFAGSFTDAEGNGLAGVAIVGNVAAAEGVWQYGVSGSWTDVGVVAPDNALIIAAADSLRFVPAVNYNGAVPDTLAVYIMDDSSGSAVTGSRVDLTLPGATGAATVYSAATVNLDTSIIAVNDAPAASGDGTLASVNEDDSNPVGATAASLFAGSFSDPADNDALAGIAIVADTTAGEGTWQYGDGLGTWISVGSVTQDSALVVAATDYLRFVPAANFNGDVLDTLTLHLVEDSGGSVASGTIVDLSAPGATGADTVYSGATIHLDTSIIAVPDAPSLTVDDATPLAYVEADPVTALDLTAVVTDPEQDWNLGTLGVQITGNPEAADQISIMTDATVTLNGLQVSVGINYVGDASAALVTSGTSLTITFNALATDADVQEIIRHIGYDNTSSTPSTLQREVTLTATDAGLHSDAGSTAVRRIDVTDTP